MRRARLIAANLGQARLGRADLSCARLGLTTFAENDLEEVRDLETVVHEGPSWISIDTFYRSHEKIPLAFLRGAGIPENFVEYMGSLTGKAFEFYSCFISYSTKDQEFADRLYADLQNKGIRCWFVPHDMQAGKKMHEQIDEAIRRYERLLLILSPNSMNSEWVKTEISKARKRERTGKRRVLFPFGWSRLMQYEIGSVLTQTPGKTRPRKSGNTSYQTSATGRITTRTKRRFSNLLRDLKTGQTKAAET